MSSTKIGEIITDVKTEKVEDNTDTLSHKKSTTKVTTSEVKHEDVSSVVTTHKQYQGGDVTSSEDNETESYENDSNENEYDSEDNESGDENENENEVESNDNDNDNENENGDSCDDEHDQAAQEDESPRSIVSLESLASLGSNGTPRRGRPRTKPSNQRKSSRPRGRPANPHKLQKEVVLDENGNPRGRGRPAGALGKKKLVKPPKSNWISEGDSKIPSNIALSMGPLPMSMVGGFPIAEDLNQWVNRSVYNEALSGSKRSIVGVNDDALVSNQYGNSVIGDYPRSSGFASLNYKVDSDPIMRKNNRLIDLQQDFDLPSFAIANAQYQEIPVESDCKSDLLKKFKSDLVYSGIGSPGMYGYLSAQMPSMYPDCGFPLSAGSANSLYQRRGGFPASAPTSSAGISMGPPLSAQERAITYNSFGNISSSNPKPYPVAPAIPSVPSTGYDYRLAVDTMTPANYLSSTYPKSLYRYNNRI